MERVTLTRTLIGWILGALISGAASANVDGLHPDDPWEPFNRKVFAFNDTLDKYLLKPVAEGYRFVAPVYVDHAVTNVFNNFSDVVTAGNSVLQGKGENTIIALGRVVFNTTFGIVGLIDVGTPMGLTADEEDFGQTLAVWGFGSGPYLVLPLLGPSTVRDTPRLIVDGYLYPPTYLFEERERWYLAGLRIIDARADLLAAEGFVIGDRYQALRNAYLQRRDYLINDGVIDDPFADDPFLDEIE